jgi:diadenylate cyclase
VSLISTFLQQISIKDIFDITIVAVLLYQIILIVNRTRAVQMLFGVAGLGLLYLVGKTYQLSTITWLLEHFFDYIFLILIIVFQDQIKAGLASFGSGRKVFWGLKKVPKDDEIDEIIDVCCALGRRKIGGLIVFERTNGLKNFMTTGTSIGSEIHSDLLYAIFQSTSPLHDGAVIISDNKVAAAGCFLPLSQASELDRQLGTRHRAGIGVSEVTDALAVVISEETGKMNVCSGGIIYPVKDGSDLRLHLKKFLGNYHFDINEQKKRDLSGGVR